MPRLLNKWNKNKDTNKEQNKAVVNENKKQITKPPKSDSVKDKPKFGRKSSQVKKYSTPYKSYGNYSARGLGKNAVDAPVEKNKWTPVVIILAVLILMTLGIGFFSNYREVDGIIKSTVQRSAIDPTQYVKLDKYVICDIPDMDITNFNESGLRYFYTKTGIQPVVYITDETDDLNSLAEKKYDTLISDNGHLFFVLGVELDDAGNIVNYKYNIEIGKDASSLMDNEAMAILSQYIDRAWNSESRNTFVSVGFENTTNRIMSITKSYLRTAFIVAAVLGILLILAIILMIKFKNKDKDTTEKPSKSIKPVKQNKLAKPTKPVKQSKQVKQNKQVIENDPDNQYDDYNDYDDYDDSSNQYNDYDQPDNHDQLNNYNNQQNNSINADEEFDIDWDKF